MRQAEHVRTMTAPRSRVEIVVPYRTGPKTPASPHSERAHPRGKVGKERREQGQDSSEVSGPLTHKLSVRQVNERTHPAPFPDEPASSFFSLIQCTHK